MGETLLGTLVVIAAFMAVYYALQRKRERRRDGEAAPPACDGACECCRDAGGCRYAGKGPPRASSGTGAP